MSPYKHAALAAYYYTTAPLRAARNSWLSRRGHAPVHIVTYHRVADDAANDWTTSNQVFEKGIRWLRRNFDIVTLDEARRRIASGENHRPTVCITFDDGYAVNLDRALPLLIDSCIPFTYFVTAGAILQREFFEHDVAMGNKLALNTVNDIRRLIAAGVEIGAHTRTHADLGAVRDEVTLYDEIVTAGRELEDAIGQPVRYFAFPFGQKANLSRRSFEIAADAGYEAVLSAYGGTNFPGDDAFHLQRMCVDGPLTRLKNWTTLDPIKQIRIRRYQYRSADELPGAVGALQS